MRIETEVKLDYKDVLFRPKRSTINSRKEVDITREFEFTNSGQTWKGVPIMAANMDTIGTLEIAKVFAEYGMFTCLHKFYTAEEIAEIADEKFFKNCAVSTGTRDKDLETLQSIMKKAGKKVKFICVDVANGYTTGFLAFVKKVRKLYPKVTIIAGNVVTGEMVEELILAGADIVKVGIGPGSVCTTRLKTGVGYPQLSAVMECADAAHGLGGKIIADGGCTSPGDVAKAFGAGADFVMLGGMLSGHDENPGEIIEENGKKFKMYYGMSSEMAMQKHYGGKADYRAAEGKVVKVPYRGDMSNTVEDVLGGLRSCCTYIGARRLKDVPKCTTFVRVTQQLNNIFS